MKVALCHPVFWPEVRRGAERFTWELARGLAARGHRPRIVTSHRGRPATTDEQGIPVTRTWRPPDARLRRRLYDDFLVQAPGTYVALRRGRDDVAQAMQAADAVAAARWARATGGVAVFAHMGIPHRAALANRRGRLAVTLRATRECHAVTALSQHAADAFERWLGVSARVIHPPVDLETFAPGGERAAEPLIFCPAAPDEPRKRVGLLVEAYALLTGRGFRPPGEHPQGNLAPRASVPLRRPVRLVLLRPADPARARELAALPGVELADPGEDSTTLAGRYRNAWVTALPSIGEAFGLVLAESLACGTPVVGSNREAIPEIVDRPAVGRTFDGGARELADVLHEALELAADPATASACRERAEAFSSARCAAAYEALYRELRN